MPSRTAAARSTASDNWARTPLSMAATVSRSAPANIVPRSDGLMGDASIRMMTSFRAGGSKSDTSAEFYVHVTVFVNGGLHLSGCAGNH